MNEMEAWGDGKSIFSCDNASLSFAGQITDCKLIKSIWKLNRFRKVFVTSAPR